MVDKQTRGDDKDRRNLALCNLKSNWYDLTKQRWRTLAITIHTGALLSKQVWQQVELTVLVAKFTGSLAQSLSVSLVWSLVWYGIPIHWADADGRGGTSLYEDGNHLFERARGSHSQASPRPGITSGFEARSGSWARSPPPPYPLDMILRLALAGLPGAWTAGVGEGSG